jgi:hypothetical protein
VSGLEWTWSKDKFLDRKTMMSEYYADFRENGQIDTIKYQTFDPFQGIISKIYLNLYLIIINSLKSHTTLQLKSALQLCILNQWLIVWQISVIGK